MSKTSFRYGGGQLDLRSAFIRLCASLQGKKAVLLNTNPQNFGQILAASETKGTFIEHIFANPAWNPIASVESVDGELWEDLSKNCRTVIGQIKWRDRLVPIIHQNIESLTAQAQSHPDFVINAEGVSRLTLRIMYELAFESQISKHDESLFYQASLEWRKEIALKGKGDDRIKYAFWERLTDIVAKSPFGEGLQKYKHSPERWLSVFAQPFLISPQINISDVMVAIFHFLRAHPGQMKEARHWARNGELQRLNGVVMEAIRLQHPFPILEREIQKNLKVADLDIKAGTQVFMLMDQLQQDPEFKPERWNTPAENPYASIPFGAGRRMCIGKPIAQELMVNLLQNFLNSFDDSQIRPQENHLYSGRNNDRQTKWTESLYQMKVFGRALSSSFHLGRLNASPTRSCPFSMFSKG